MSQIGDITPNDFIKSQIRDAVKEYTVYDGSNRISATYTAGTGTPDGGPCLKTTYTYWLTSNRIKLRVESVSAWQLAWES
jgi:hypothetical protein